jgi:phosphoribosylformylglycinamidine cyclo-ligase
VVKGAKGLYADAGVDIEAGNRAVDLMSAAVRSTYGPEVLLGVGAFGGCFDATALKEYNSPVLVASTDSVGTKVMVAVAAGRYDTIGQDIVNHCVDDILVQGARPLFFLDYVASSVLVPEQVAAVVQGVAVGCREAGCALIGGETAELPGVYQPGELDLVGAIVGVVEREEIIDGSAIQPGDILLGLPSNGLHTNGYSLVRKVFERTPLSEYVPELGSTLGDEILRVHRSYLAPVESLRRSVQIKGLAHITGGGFIDNIPRILPNDLGVRIDAGSWEVLPIFTLIQRRSGMESREMYHVFNMGIGMVAVVGPEDVDLALNLLNGDAEVVGKVVSWTSGERVAIA